MTKASAAAPPNARSPRTRERILHATVLLMAEIGIDRVRTRDIAKRAGVNLALVHYHFGSVPALVMEAAEDALQRELGPSIGLFRAGGTIGESVRAILKWIESDGEHNPGSTILAEAMVKATRSSSFRRWTMRASRRFRTAIRARLEVAREAGEMAPDLDLDATALLLAAALDGLLFHRLVDPKLDVVKAAAPLDALLCGRPRPVSRIRRRTVRGTR